MCSVLVYFSRINNKVDEILLPKNGFNSENVRSNSFVNNT